MHFPHSSQTFYSLCDRGSQTIKDVQNTGEEQEALAILKNQKIARGLKKLTNDLKLIQWLTKPERKLYSRILPEMEEIASFDCSGVSSFDCSVLSQR